MKKNLQSIQRMVWKGSLIMISYFLFAACMQHDESLSPRKSHNDLLSKEINAEASDQSMMAKRTFTAHLSGGNEVPANDSRGQGQLILKINEDETEVYYKLIASNIEEVKVAHIHCGEEGVNGPPVIFLFGPVAEGVAPNGILAEGTFDADDFIARGASATCVGGLATFADFIARLRSGGTYVNAHNDDFPGGEIRGQIK